MLVSRPLCDKNRQALLTNEMRHYISICMKVKVGIIGKIEIRMQVSKMVYTVINSDCFAVILLGTLENGQIFLSGVSRLPARVNHQNTKRKAKLKVVKRCNNTILQLK